MYAGEMHQLLSPGAIFVCIAKECTGPMAWQEPVVTRVTLTPWRRRGPDIWQLSQERRNPSNPTPVTPSRAHSLFPGWAGRGLINCNPSPSACGWVRFSPCQHSTTDVRRNLLNVYWIFGISAEDSLVAMHNTKEEHQARATTPFDIGSRSRKRKSKET